MSIPTSSSSSTDRAEPASSNKDATEVSRGLQEERVDRDAWVGILDALNRLKAARERERALKNAGQTGSTSQTRGQEDSMDITV